MPVHAELTLDVESTGKIDLEAAWTEKVDDPDLPAWV